MSPYGSDSRPNSQLKTRFTRRFIKSLFKIKATTSSSTTATTRRNIIKMASYSSMARAVGSRRAWSRAFLFKIRCRIIRRRATGLLVMRRRRRCRIRHRVISKKGILLSSRVDDDDGEWQVSKLRKIVPGGVKMDMCMLLEETAHYIKCLATQVKVMENTVNALSTTTT